MRTIFRICRSESQPGLQPVERLATPLNYTLFLYNSHHWKTFLYSSFSFWTQLFYLTLFAEHFQLALSDYTVKPCNFQLDRNKFLYTATFVLVLIPEPVFYIWLRCELRSLILTRWILLLAASYFKLDLVYFQLNFGIFVSARFRLFRPSCFVKKGGL